MEENKEVTSGAMRATKALDVSHYGLTVEKLFGLGRGIDVTTVATRIVTPFLGPYSNLRAKWNTPYIQVMLNHLFDKVKNRF